MPRQRPVFGFFGLPSGRRTHGWPTPPLQVYSYTGVPLAVPAFLTSRHFPVTGFFNALVPLVCRCHTWYAPLLHAVVWIAAPSAFTPLVMSRQIFPAPPPTSP